MPQPGEPSGFERLRSSFNVFSLIVNSMACTVQVFVHKDIGERAVGFRGLVGAGLIMLWSILFPLSDPRPMLGLLVAYLGMCWWARVTALHSRLKGRVGHTRYNGYPRVMRFFPRLSEVKVKRAVEPCLVLGTGALCLGLSEPLGAYLIVSAVALFLSVDAIELHEQQRALDLLDSSIDQQGLAERFRSLRSDRR